MAVTHTMLPPANGATTTVSGRVYTAAAGVILANIPDFDKPTLEAAGWTATANGGSGATAARPASPQKGATFNDTTLGYVVVFDGKAWRHPQTGASI
jgi:hypothetical protein